MDISYGIEKRAITLQQRGLDFADAPLVFAGEVVTVEDTRKNYGETRWITAGHLNGRCVVLVWTPRGNAYHIISMRYAHAKEERRWFP